MSFNILAEVTAAQQQEDILGWLLWALAACCGAIVSMATYYVKVIDPRHMELIRESAKTLQSIQDANNVRLDAREAAHDEEVALNHELCRKERLARDELFRQEMMAFRVAVDALATMVALSGHDRPSPRKPPHGG